MPDVETPNVLKKKAPTSSIPNDYIWPRGPEQDALEGARAIIAPPVGYHNLLLCAGAEKLEHFTNVNHVKVSDDDVVHPIEKMPWPFADNTVLKINIGAYLCQVRDLDTFMRECWRVLVQHGTLLVKVPYYTSEKYWSNRRNVTPITDETLGYYSTPWLKKNGVYFKPGCDFDWVGRLFYFNNDFELIGDHAREYARRHSWNVVETMEVCLSAVKPMREL